MFSYFAYGVGIQSELPIPEFIHAQRGCDVTVHIDNDHTAVDYLSEQVISQPWNLKLSLEESVLYIKEVAVFLVQGGDKIVVIPAPNACDILIRFYLVGTVMAILLYQRGLLVLHGSVVNIHGGAVVFLGVSGQGKSSTSAAFLAQGYGFLSDDVAPVTLGTKPATIAPGFPQIKLSRETAAALGYDFESLLVLHPDDEKRGYRLTQNFSQTPLPISRIYVLADDTEFGIEPLNPRDSVMELVQHSRPTTLYHSGGTSHFLQCVALAKEQTIYRLKRPRDLTLLPELVKLVENHLSCQIQSVVV
ncbi:serine kinase [aff. Roholtiella sp. LEGE 12411]|uniref:serine kinase n=1 Tax=aff. Roholtiella sp. LEGE 12411 TaxID=1828822 RepID=UPI0018827401|nr:serine kinase [aff. Roholtiella sp. LEGE 12411]MBE9038104.1 serine kinase [aff. Roholtiella sp. LEGE 12411]